MSLSSITRAATDPDLINRVTSAANQVVRDDPDKADTVFGQQLLNGTGMAGTNPVAPLMYPVAIATEAAYETALLAGRGAPGYDKDIITDDAIETAVLDGWPMTRPPAPPTPNPAVLTAPTTDSRLSIDDPPPPADNTIVLDMEGK